jgi:hypothetical protein
MLLCLAGCAGGESKEAPAAEAGRGSPPGSSDPAQGPEGRKPEPKEVQAAEEARTIPLEAIYATNGQKGLKPVLRLFKEPYGHDLNELFRSSAMGASNLFLVRGEDLAAAVKGTRLVFTGGLPAERVVEGPNVPKAAPLWAVAYLGTAGSNPPMWLVQSVVLKGPTVRVTFRKEKPLSGSTGDVHQYFVWIPLGQGTARTYTLELFDAEQQEVVLSRRVTVAETE